MRLSRAMEALKMVRHAIVCEGNMAVVDIGNGGNGETGGSWPCFTLLLLNIRDM